MGLSYVPKLENATQILLIFDHTNAIIYLLNQLKLIKFIIFKKTQN